MTIQLKSIVNFCLGRSFLVKSKIDCLEFKISEEVGLCEDDNYILISCLNKWWRGRNCTVQGTQKCPILRFTWTDSTPLFNIECLVPGPNAQPSTNYTTSHHKNNTIIYIHFHNKNVNLSMIFKITKDSTLQTRDKICIIWSLRSIIMHTRGTLKWGKWKDRKLLKLVKPNRKYWIWSGNWSNLEEKLDNIKKLYSRWIWY